MANFQFLDTISIRFYGPKSNWLEQFSSAIKNYRFWKLDFKYILKSYPRYISMDRFARTKVEAFENNYTIAATGFLNYRLMPDPRMLLITLMSVSSWLKVWDEERFNAIGLTVKIKNRSDIYHRIYSTIFSDHPNHQVWNIHPLLQTRNWRLFAQNSFICSSLSVNYIL